MNHARITTDTLSKQLRRHVYTLAEQIGERNVFHPQQLDEAADYITQVWRKQGYQITPQEYTVRGIHSANLAITKPGITQPDQIILVGAHYDSVTGSPGANDNGSGIAALLELSQLLNHDAPAKTIRFVAFVNEEPPFFFTRQQGSYFYAQEAHRRGDSIELMIALETIGYYRNEPHSQRYPPLFRFFYPDRANFVSFVSNFRSRKAMRKLAQLFSQCSDFPLEHVATFSFIPGVAWSDHLSFWRQNYPALMVTDTAFYRYPYYHTAEDTAEKVDYISLAKVTMGLYGAISLLAL